MFPLVGREGDQVVETVLHREQHELAEPVLVGGRIVVNVEDVGVSLVVVVDGGDVYGGETVVGVEIRTPTVGERGVIH